MSILIDPQTRQRVLYSRHICDIQYDAITTEKAILNESIPLIGKFFDRPVVGNGGPDSRAQQMTAGIANELQGTDAQIESNAKVGNLNEVGENAETIRRRKRLIHRFLPKGQSA